jgi:antitoxin MazE
MHLDDSSFVKGGAAMSTVVKTRIVKIGNSQGIRIPKLLLEQTSLGDEVELELLQGQIVVRPAYHVRHRWEEAFKAMAERRDDELLDGDVLTSITWDEEGWEW